MNENKGMPEVPVPTRPDPKTCAHRPDPNIAFYDKDTGVGSICVNCGCTIHRAPIVPRNLKQVGVRLMREDGPKVHMTKKERLAQREALRKLASSNKEKSDGQ